MASRTALMETIANRFLARREELAEEMTERIRAGVAEFAGFDGPELWEAVRASCLANLEAGLASMAHDQALPEVIPADARDLALLTAPRPPASPAKVAKNCVVQPNRLAAEVRNA